GSSAILFLLLHLLKRVDRLDSPLIKEVELTTSASLLFRGSHTTSDSRSPRRCTQYQVSGLRSNPLRRTLPPRCRHRPESGASSGSRANLPLSRCRHSSLAPGNRR